MRVALFVEGSSPPPEPRREPPLQTIWNEHLGKHLGLHELDPIIPISKTHLVALDPANPPSTRTAPPRLEPGMILPLCMEPMFESILCVQETATLRALELSSRPPNWPTRGWNDRTEKHPDRRVLAPAIATAKSSRPKPRVFRRIPGDLRTNKDGWGEYLLRQLLKDSPRRSALLDNPILQRLREIGSR